MGFMDKLKGNSDNSTAPKIAVPTGTVSLSKGGSVSLSKTPVGGLYTLLTEWGSKDYDAYALVEYQDGHVEVVSCFGTTNDPKGFSLQTKDGAVVHASGDKAANGGPDMPREYMYFQLNPNIRTIVPVVYSAKNSGAGSFAEYGVSTFVIEGRYQQVPSSGAKVVSVVADDANTDSNVYSFVPAIIHNDSNGPSLEVVELYSRRNSELRPTVRNGKVKMDDGLENAMKPRPIG